MKVHNVFGLGFPEIIYHRSLMIELTYAGLSFEQEVEKEIFYKGNKVGLRRLDLIIENKLIIEIKATSDIEPAHQNQLLNYLKLFNMEVGLILNFGRSSLQFKRFAYY
jgi:GxxExxY protein